MLIEEAKNQRQLKTESIDSDLVVCGGGLAGACAAITAARAGLSVTLVQDRPVLGGNASSEVRLWVLGATAHMGNNNRWAREGGVIDEILVENRYRNPEGNPLLVDLVILEKVVSEPRIRLLLNTSVYEVEKEDGDPDKIVGLHGFCSQNSTLYILKAPLFCDASGDGIVGFLSGAAFRMGAEASDEFGEGFAPTEEYGHLLGHSIYFMTKDVGRPVKFVPPSFALKDPEKVIPRFREFDISHQACQFWWIEYGGRLDTVHDTEEIKWELWKTVYGVWDYVKNSGKFPQAETKALEWVGHIPGKRESRRFEGDYMMRQKDLVEQRRHRDAVSFGGWCLDLHPADGIFTEKPGCTQWHSKGVYQIPYRSMYSRNIKNLFLAGRIISCSHVAFSSTRVMATCAHGGQAVGMAAVLCRESDCLPRDLFERDHVPELQKRLLRAGQHIPGVRLEDPEDLCEPASISASSRYRLASLPPDGPLLDLVSSRAMLVPVSAGRVPRFQFNVIAEEETELEIQLRASSRIGNFTPDVILATQTIRLDPAASLAEAVASANSGKGFQRTGDEGRSHPGVVERRARKPGGEGEEATQTIDVDFEREIEHSQYLFVCLMANSAVSVLGSQRQITGIRSLTNTVNSRVAKGSRQTPPDEYGFDSFEFWLPERRPKGWNLAFAVDNPLDVFGEENLRSGCDRPFTGPNAWVASPDDPAPQVTLQWDRPQSVRGIVLVFDTDADDPMETVVWDHPDRIMPFCVRRYRVTDADGNLLAECEDNHQTINRISLSEPVTTRKLQVTIEHPSSDVPAALMSVRCYG